MTDHVSVLHCCDKTNQGTWNLKFLQILPIFLHGKYLADNAHWKELLTYLVPHPFPSPSPPTPYQSDSTKQFAKSSPCCSFILVNRTNTLCNNILFAGQIKSTKPFVCTQLSIYMRHTNHSYLQLKKLQTNGFFFSVCTSKTKNKQASVAVTRTAFDKFLSFWS